METFRLVIAGVGGQGSLLASRILAEAAIKSGLPVMIGETYGMAQRGGPVMGHIQIGGESSNPQIRKGEADALMAFEPAEAARRGIVYLKTNGLALVNTRKTPPVEVISGRKTYPKVEDLIALLGKVTKNVISFDATSLAEEAGDPIVTNVVMIGALAQSGMLPYDEEKIIQVMKENLSRRYLELNMKAFELGKKSYISKVE